MRQGKYFPQKCRLKASDGIFYAVSAAVCGSPKPPAAASARSHIKEGGTRRTVGIFWTVAFLMFKTPFLAAASETGISLMPSETTAGQSIVFQSFRRAAAMI
ncbi:TPA: hypothetical protein ACFRHF_000490 [Neisseria lactamica]